MPGKISTEKIEDVRLASDIVDIISGYLSLQKKGKGYFGLCPFHKEKTPSFSVNPEQQIFHCFGCGVGGNVFTFIMRMEGLTFPESVRLLAKSAGIIIPEQAGIYGINNTPWAEQDDLTTISFNPELWSEKIFSAIDELEKADDQCRIFIPPTLVQRSSTKRS